MVTFKVRHLCLQAPLTAVLSLFVAFLEYSLWDVVLGLRYSPLDVLCCLNMVSFHCRFYFLKQKRSRKMRDQVIMEAAASP